MMDLAMFYGEYYRAANPNDNEGGEDLLIIALDVGQTIGRPI